MMAKLPEDRPMTAAAVRQELLRWASDTPQPVEQAGDSTYQQAVASLQAGEGSSDLLIVPLPPQLLEPPANTPAGWLQRLLARATETQKDYLWIMAALLGFWIFVLLGLLLMLLLR
jgi:hypothetical protein